MNNVLQSDTIVNISTGLTPSGVGIIRVSGNNGINIVSSIFTNKEKKQINIEETHKVKYGYIYDKKNNEFLDEVLCITMRAPHSYTTEDIVEIQCHGGIRILKNILSLIIKSGARLAEPGEFTKRAFLNGRIDLSKAEAVADLISSKNDYAAKAGISKLKGNLSEKLNQLRSELIESIAFIEASLDDPEHMSLDGFTPKLKKQTENMLKELNHIIKNYDSGKIIKEGINTVILGKPNVGKSSLLNLLLKEDRAIVTEIAGTTRDTLKETININGITLNIIDTAGIRNDESLDKVEEIGIKKALSEAENADLLIIMLDATKKDYIDDLKIFDKFLDKKKIILLNKCDINNKKEPDMISFSTKTGLGLSELTDTIEKMFINKELNWNDEIFISNERELRLIESAVNSLNNVINSINSNMPEDVLTIDLNSALTSLSEVLGIKINDDVVNEIFSKFCMGK